MEILVHGAAQLGLSLSAQHLERFQTLYEELCAWNERLNLTAITGYQEVQTRHLLDSLSCLLAFPAGEPSNVIPDTVPVQRPGSSLRCLDVGTGAGFPGLPLRILLPDLRLTLLESVGKKVAWLQHIVRELNLSDVEIILGRAEEVGHVAAQRELFDVVVARAVAPLKVLVEYCLPFCRPGGRMIAPRGEDAVREGTDAGAAIALLGGRLVAVKEVPPPIGLPDHYLVVIDKIEKTPERYPRRIGIPSKRPLPAVS
jgi:16S rRNA (guanine527-N7)-methyltransferase